MSLLARQRHKLIPPNDTHTRFPPSGHLARLLAQIITAGLLVDFWFPHAAFNS